ncbi:signal peptide peptidase SppA [Opitutaceae bacterium TAV4]|nr:signal peptide peptidase SppA [Opitutaceae bacterium TAV4]RRJ98651.1 signal peptide peptidase SppA [Opitutaceae bacterium TAV3]
MKSFFASLLGTLVALILFAAGSIAVAVMFIVGLSMIEKETIRIEPGSYLVFNLSGTNLTDSPPSFDATSLGGLLTSDKPESISLRLLTKAIRTAATDKRIRGLYLTGHFAPDGYGTGFASLREVRAALAEFRAANKPIRAWFDSPGTLEYYLGSTATELALDPFGLIEMPGLASQPMFFAGALEKYGVGVQVTRSGKYKSAVEPFTRSDLSPESREQLQKLLDDLWTTIVAEVTDTRQLPAPDTLQKLVDKEGLITPQAALDAGLIHRIAYRDEILAELQDATGEDALTPFTQIDIRDYTKTLANPKLHPQKKQKRKSNNGARLAIVYAEGEIVDGEGEIGVVGGDAFSREIRALRLDDDIAAIVLRVNSPGGSASASEHILRELQLAAEVKPVVVSMGNYAASGGYWIALSGGRIFAEPTTITGSIGVFGLQFDVQKLANTHGVTWDGVKTGRYAGAFTLTRPKTPAEMAIFQRLVDWTYAEFIKRVSTARSLEPARVQEIAQGRVWSGLDAHRLGLVDELGGLTDALAYAAREAGLGDRYTIEEIPATIPFSQLLADLFSSHRYPESRLATLLRPAVSATARGPFTRLLAETQTSLRTLDHYNDPRGVYSRLEYDIRPR